MLGRRLCSRALVELLGHVAARGSVGAHRRHVGIAALHPIARGLVREGRPIAELRGTQSREVVRAARVVHVAGIAAHGWASAGRAPVVDRIGGVEQALEPGQSCMHSLVAHRVRSASASRVNGGENHCDIQLLRRALRGREDARAIVSFFGPPESVQSPANLTGFRAIEMRITLVARGRDPICALLQRCPGHA